MEKQLHIDLPNLNEYRQLLVEQGAIIPLPKVPFSRKGLLSELPCPPDGKTGWPWTVEVQPPTAMISNGLTWPKISIVTPSYNQGRFIEETIRSVLLQNYPNVEYIIFDGDSTDQTKEIVEKYSPWLSFWQSKKDRGQGHAINLGFSIASGDYFGWINSDDFYLPHCFQLVVTHFYKNHPDLIYGDSITIYDNDSKAVYCYGNLALDRYLRFGNIVFSHAIFWKSSIHVPICETINCAIDYELWLRLLPRKFKVHLKYPLGVFRVQELSKSSDVDCTKLWQKDHETIVNYYGLPPKPRSYISYEFTLIQKIYKKFRKPIKNVDIFQLYLNHS